MDKQALKKNYRIEDDMLLMSVGTVLVIIFLLTLLPTIVVGFFWAFYLSYLTYLVLEEKNYKIKSILLVINSIQVLLVNAYIIRYFSFTTGVELIEEYSFLSPEKYLNIAFFTYWGGTILGIVGAIYFSFNVKFKSTFGKSTLEKISNINLSYEQNMIIIFLFFGFIILYFSSDFTNGITHIVASKFDKNQVLALENVERVNNYFGYGWMSLVNAILISISFFIFNMFVFRKLIDVLDIDIVKKVYDFNSLVKEKNEGKDIVLGHIENKEFALSWSDINHHPHILGQSGAGKSVLLRNIYSALTVRDKGFLLVDLKAESEMKHEMIDLCIATKREKDLVYFDITDIENSVSYNPILRGNATELKDKFMMCFVWSEEYYKKKAESFLLNILRAIVVIRDEVGQLPTIKDIFDCINNPKKILEMREVIPEKFIEIRDDLALIQQSLKNDPDQRKALEGLKTNLEVMIKSEFGKLMVRSESVDLLDVILNDKIFYIMLDGQTYGETANSIARLIVSDLRSCSGFIASNIPKEKRPEFASMTDEFEGIVSTKELGKMFAGHENRSRSSGIGNIFAHQSLGDFDDEQVKSQILDNSETLFSFVQKDDKTAEKISKMIGTYTTEKKTFQIEKTIFGTRKLPTGSVRETEEFKVHPNVIKNLNVGECLYFAKKPTRVGILKVRYLDLSGIKSGKKSLKPKLKLKEFSQYIGKKSDEKIDKTSEKFTSMKTNFNAIDEIKETKNEFDIHL